MCRNIVQPPKRQIKMILWIYMKEENFIYDQIILTTMTMLPLLIVTTHNTLTITIETCVVFFLDRHTNVTGF
jgi:hypothetical protein